MDALILCLFCWVHSTNFIMWHLTVLHMQLRQLIAQSRNSFKILKKFCKKWFRKYSNMYFERAVASVRGWLWFWLVDSSMKLAMNFICILAVKIYIPGRQFDVGATFSTTRWSRAAIRYLFYAHFRNRIAGPACSNKSRYRRIAACSLWLLSWSFG